MVRLPIALQLYQPLPFIVAQRLQVWQTTIPNLCRCNRYQMLESIYLYCHLTMRFQENILLFDMAAQELTNAQEAEKRRIWGRLVVRLNTIAYKEQGYEMVGKALQIAREYDDLNELAKALLVINFMLDRLGKPEQAQIFAEESLALLRQTGDLFYKAAALELLARLVATRLGDWDRAERLWLEAKDVCRESGDKLHLPEVLAWLGILEAFVRHRPDRAKAYFRESLVASRELRSTRHICDVLRVLALLLCSEGNLDEVETTAHEGLVLARGANHHDSIRASLLNLGWVKSYQQDYRNFLELIHEAQTLIPPDDDPIINAYMQLVQGIALCGLGEYETAQRLLCIVLYIIFPRAVTGELLELVLGFGLVLAYYQRQHERA